MNCRICGTTSFGNVIDLGDIPLVNDLLSSPDEVAPRWPLQVVWCISCGLAQLTEAPSPEVIFREYTYFSSQSQTMVDHARALVHRYVKPGQRVVEVASNDGYLLLHAKTLGAEVLGIDPAENIAAHAASRGIPTRCAFFDRATAQSIARAGHADVVFANNVLAHTPDPHEFVAALKIVLSDAGVAHVEVPYLPDLLEQTAFDTIYHEHHCYFAANPLRELFHAHGLCVIGIEHIPIHGGSLHLTLAHDGSEATAERFCVRERDSGLMDQSTYDSFAGRVTDLRHELDSVLDRFENVAAYGAAAKGVVVLNHFQLGVDRIPWVADVSPHKQGRFVPGTAQPIVPPERLMTEQPDACLILPWNIAPEIERENHAYAERGGRFVTANPRLNVR